MLNARRWTRYGHDRVYVTLHDGTRVGFIDLKTGKTTIERPEWSEEFYEAVGPYVRGSMQDWLDSVQVETAASEAPAPPPVSQPAGLPPPPAAPSAESLQPDLTANAPGQGARQEATEHLDAMRERSRFLTFVARTFDVKTDERAWRKGAEGEEHVGAKLERLKEHGWHVLHSVPVGQRGSDIDHVLVGPGGVFTINTKNHPGKKIWVAPNQMRVDGRTVPYLRNSRFEAERASDLLTARLGWQVRARAVLVLLTGGLAPQVTIKSGGPTDVWILDRWDIPRKFTKAKPILMPAEVDAVFDAARRPGTWTAAY